MNGDIFNDLDGPPSRHQDRDQEVPTGRMDGHLTPTGRTDSKLVRIKVGPQLTCAKGVDTF